MTVVSPATDPNSTTVQVWVQAENPGEQLKPGTSVHVAIIDGDHQGRHRGPGRRDPARRGRRHRLSCWSRRITSRTGGRVKLGVREGDKVQILNGVRPGEEVVIVGGIGLDDKAKVKVIDADGEGSSGRRRRRPRSKPARTRRRTRRSRNPNERPDHQSPTRRTGPRGTASRSSSSSSRWSRSASIWRFTIPVAVFPETEFPAHRHRRRQRRLPHRPDAGHGHPAHRRGRQHRARAASTCGPSPAAARPKSTCSSPGTWTCTTRCELVNAALARVQPTLPPTAKITANRLTFAAFPIIGYSLTSDNVPQTKLWEMATYELKPRLNRQDGVSTVVVQGGQVPEFQVQPDPAKLVQAGVTVPNILDAIGRSNMIDSPGLIETQSPAGAEPGERAGADAGRDRATSSSRPRPPARPFASATSPRSRPR